MKLPFIETDLRLGAIATGIAAAALLSGCQSMGKGAALGAVNDRVIENGAGRSGPQAGLFHPARTPSGAEVLPQGVYAPEGHYY